MARNSNVDRSPIVTLGNVVPGREKTGVGGEICCVRKNDVRARHAPTADRLMQVDVTFVQKQDERAYRSLRPAYTLVLARLLLVL